jgi:hypothetical protein
MAIIGLGLVNILIHIAFYNNIEYHRDELLYFSLGLHPAFGYATVPPMIGWIAGLMQSLFGFTLFSVKIFPALLSGAFVILCSSIARESGGKAYARILTGIAIIIMPVSLRSFHLFQPVHLDLFFWTWIFYMVLRYINSGKDKYLILTGAFFLIAMLIKYLVTLLFPALMLPVLFTRHREIFLKKSFYIGLLLGLLVFMPNLLWQIWRGLPVIKHMKELSESQLVYVDRTDFLKDQILMTLSSSILVITGLFYLLMEKKFRFLFFSVLFVFLSLMALRGKSYYTIGLIPLLTASGSVAAEKFLKSLTARILLPLFLILIDIPVFPIGIPVFKQDKLVSYFKKLDDKYGIDAGRRFEDGSIHSLPQDYADQLGWEELTRITSEAYQQVPEKSKSFIYCENYGQAGAIAVIGKKYDLPEPLSFNESFSYWVPRKLSDIQHLIYINDKPGEDIQKIFGEIKLIGSITNIHAREYGTAVYLCSKPLINLDDFWHSVLMRENIE